MSEPKTIDVEATKEPSQPTQALAVRQSQAVGQALGVDEIIAQVQLIQNVMHRVMKEGEHFGTIPGCGDKKTLLQPGAQKLTMTFRLCPEYEIQEVNIERGHKEYRVICTLKSMGSGAFVGQGVGCCSTMESKYRWRGGARKCPKCGKEAIIMGKKFKPTDPEPGWLCWKKKEGCGATWPKGAAEIEGQSTEKVENENPADCYNTVLKMAKKRAFVDATITATAASDIFTQDIGDDEAEPEAEPPQNAPGRATPSPHTNPPAKVAPAPQGARNPMAPAPKPPALPFPTAESRAKMIAALKAGPGEPNRDIVTEYFRKLENPAQLMPGEEIEDLPLRFVPATVKQMQALSEKLAEFGNGERATAAFPSHPEPAPPKPTAEAPKPEAPKKPIEVPRENVDKLGDQDAWRSFPMPWGKQAGTPLEDLEKNYLFGLWLNYEVETEFKGKPKRPESIAKDETFRAMLDLAGKHYEFKKPD